MRHADKYLRTVLFEAAMSGSRTKGSYFRDKYGHMLTRRVDYHELGEAWLDQLDQQRTARNLRRRLEHLGYEVTMVPRQPTSGILEAAVQAA